MLISNDLQTLNLVFEVDFKSEDDIRKYMKGNKTDCALAIFNWDKDISFPGYITEAIEHVRK